MVRKASLIGAVVALALAGVAHAQTAFCQGWEDGWNAAYENAGKLPALVPLCPLPNLGGDTYQAGYQRGMLAALSRMR